ncbi:CASP-like protein 4A1 [Schistocerca americana]|uniref:CASP-like protein 4A1 n=1 Tax=Schistocerca americana TaxID=7009 RepID=UPI001F4F81AD|nr:CASP-like protein 4A1 [Schistocerca americana]
MRPKFWGRSRSPSGCRREGRRRPRTAARISIKRAGLEATPPRRAFGYLFSPSRPAGRIHFLGKSSRFHKQDGGRAIIWQETSSGRAGNGKQRHAGRRRPARAGRCPPPPPPPPPPPAAVYLPSLRPGPAGGGGRAPTAAAAAAAAAELTIYSISLTRRRSRLRPGAVTVPYLPRLFCRPPRTSLRNGTAILPKYNYPIATSGIGFLCSPVAAEAENGKD